MGNGVIPVIGTVDKAILPGDTPGQREENSLTEHELPPGIVKARKKIETYLLTPTAFLSAASGVLSFLLANVFKNKNDFVDKTATYASKAALLTTAIYGCLERAVRQEAVGTFAFGTDFLTAALADGETLYQWRGFGSGLDQTPALLKDVRSNPMVMEAYGLGEGEEGKFNNYTGFVDSAKKAAFAVRVIAGDIVREFREKGFVEGFKSCFINRKKDSQRTAEKNLLVSGLGIIGGAFIGNILGLKKLGATVRDLMGFYGDLAVWDSGKSEKTGANRHIYRSGWLYTAGSILDLLYRWTHIENLNLLALGIDRLGAREYVIGVSKDGDHTATQNGNGKNGNGKKTETDDTHTQSPALGTELEAVPMS